MDITPLEKLGLEKSEIDIYLALLKNGASTAAQIAQHTELNRSHIYDRLNVIIERGLVSFAIRNNVKYFQAAAPEKIIDYLKEVQENVQNMIPDLKKITGISKTETVVGLYQGKEGIKTILKDIIRERKDYCVFGEEGQFQKILPVYIHQFLRDVKNYNLHERLLSKEEKRDKIITLQKNTKMRYLPDNYFSPVTTVIYGNKLAVFIWSEPFFAILIQDKGTAKSFNSYFDVLWKAARN